jgi:serine/threonine-protein kinase
VSPRDSALTPTLPDDDGPSEVKVVPVIDPASYELGDEIARGGMGRIVAARDKRLGRTVAIKILLTQKPALAARFAREATITARLQHPSIIPVHETGRLPSGEPFYVMKLVAGRSLDVEIAARVTLQERMTLLPNVIAVVDALAYAHSQQIIHRDLKPSNVLIGAFGETVVIDWGVARDLAAADHDAGDSGEMAGRGLTASGGVVGTPAFMPPEQARGGQVDERADVYALGALLYHVLAGTAPYSGTSVEVIASVLAGPPTPIVDRAPDLPADLLAIVDKSMQREPDARYASAKELAEDLRRFQDGRMVSARSYSLRTRAARFVARHRLAVAGAVVATIAAAVPLAMWQAARADADAVAEAAQRFGQEVERIESGLRQAYLLPLHDIRKERAEVRDRIDDIARDRSLVARAAVGRGYVALGDSARARAALEEAIAGGYRPPEVAFAYGRTLGALYQQARVDLQRVKDTHLRAARLAAAQLTLRDPGLAYLKMSGERGIFGEALIAFYEGRYDDAIAGARRAVEQSPTLAEAEQLEGDVLAERALEAQTKGSYADALRDSDAAGKAYAAAIDIARSDPALRIAECVRWRRLLNTQGWSDAQPESPQRMFERAITVCHDAQTADPDSPEAAEELSNVYGIHGEWQTYHGEDPLVASERAIQFGRQAVALAPGRALAHASLGLAQVRLAMWQIKIGVDPVPNLRAGIATYDRAVAIEPTQTMYNSLGVAYRNLASYEADPAPSLQKAIDSYRKALELNPSYSYAYNNITAVYQRRAELALTRGQDPAADLAEAIKASAKALELNPNFAFAAEGIGISHLLAARYLAMRGDDPAREVALALDALAKSSKIDPKFGIAHREAGSVLVDHAQYALDSGGDPEPIITTARAELAQARSLDGNDDDVPRLQAEAERIAGELANKKGASPEARFTAAAHLLDEAEGMNKRSADLFEARAKLALARARWRLDKPALDAGIKAADRALELDGTRSLPYALRGELQRLAGSSADVSFAEAFRRNPLLARRFGH